MAGLRPADPRVIDPGDVRVSGHRPQDRAGRPEVLAGLAEGGKQLPGLAEARWVGGGVGHPGREGKGSEHAQDARHRAEQGRPDRHGGPAASGFEREPGAHHDGHAEPGGRRGRGHAGPARRWPPPAGGQRQGRGDRRAGRYQGGRQDPAGAEDQPVGADARMRLGVRRGADRHPARGHDGRRDAERGPGRRGQQRRRGRRRHGLARRHAYRLQDLEIGHCRRDIPGHRLTDQEQRRHQCSQREGEQAGGLVPGQPLDQAAEELAVVQHVDVRPAGHPGQVGAERGDGRGAALEPDQRVEVVLPAGAEDVGAVVRQQGRRRQHAALACGLVRGRGAEDGAADADDAGLDPRPARRPSGPVEVLVHLLRRGQEQGYGVADVLVVDLRELRGDHDLVDAAGVEHPSGQQRRPFQGLGHVVADGRESGTRLRAAVHREPEHDRKLGQRGHLGQRPHLSPSRIRAG